MLVGRTGLSPTMVGRSSLLLRLAGLLTSGGQDEGDDRPAVALVAGEAGIGKTRLLRELITLVSPGTVVLAGQAEPGSLGRPFELVQAVLGEAAPAPGSGDEPVREACERILARAGIGPALVVFEDLHWADAESVAVFERLAAAARPDLLLVGTYRPDELTRRVPAAEALARVERRHRVHQLRLARLDRLEVAAFLAAVYRRQLPTSVVDALYHRTGGNPFFLEELLLASGDAPPEELCAQPLPWSLAELVQRQLDGLTAGERRLVEAAAVLGRRAPFDVLARMTGTSEEELIGLLRVLLDRGVLVEEADDEFSFRHALVRDAVQVQLLGRERRRLHALALSVLEDEGGADLAQLARHAAGAGQYDRLVELARLGVEHYLSVGSSHQALLLALEALPEAPEDRVLLAAGARAAWLVGQYDEALALVGRWTAVAGDDPAARSAGTRLLARLYLDLHREDDLEGVVAEIESLTTALPPGEDRAANLACLAQVHMLSERSDEALAWAARAIAEADAAGAKQVRAQALVEQGSALALLTPRRDEGVQVLRQAVEEAQAVGDWVLVARGLNNLVDYVSPAGQEHQELLAQLRQAADRAGFDMLRAYAPLHTARWAIAAGDLAVAHAALAETASLVRPDDRKASWPAHLEAFLLLEEGRLDQAERVLATPVVAHDAGLGAWRAALQLSLRAARTEPSGPDDLALLEASYSGPHAVDALEAVLERLDPALRLGLEVDDLRRHVVEPWLAAAERDPVEVAVVEGVLAAAEGRHDDAVRDVRAGLTSPAVAATPCFLQAYLGMVVARSLASLGRRTEARAAAGSVVERLERWPGWRRAEAEALVRRLEAAGGAEEAGGGLSPREREVVALLAEGLTNAELARRLYISPKTAAVHVSNILAKLGMSSRAEVAAWAVRQGMAPTGSPA